MKTEFAKPATVRGDWYVVDATGKTLGRLASQIALRLKGKHKPSYSPHVDMGDHIVVLHAEKIAVTGNKLEDKLYHRFTGFLGNLNNDRPRQAAQGTSGAGAGVRDQGYAAQDDPRPADVPQAACVCRRQAPPQRAAAETARIQVTRFLSRI